MKCLILAAGRGSRLSKRGDPKPLVPLLGLPLLERVILTARASGLNDFYVLTGYHGQKVRLFLDKLSQTRNVRITEVVNDQWQEGNGLSVLMAEKLLRENFILLMGDHIFDKQILKRLKAQRVRAGEVILAVDYKKDANPMIDIQDVTKVLAKDGKVMDIGKNITDYNAYDTGIFLCSPGIFTAIRTSIARKDSSLTGGIRLLAGEGKVRAFDVKDGLWIDVDDERAFQKAQRCLLGRLKKLSDGPISRYLNRPLSGKITGHLVKTDITPNQISYFCFILSLLGSALFFFRGYATLVAGAFLAQISSIIDGCDGEVARLKHLESDFGRWFDAVLDRYADAFLLFGLTWHAFIPNGNILALIIGFLAIIGSFMNSYTADKYDGLMARRFEAGRGFRMGRDIRIFIIFVGAIINQPFLALLLLAVLMNLENVRRVVLCYRSE